MNVTFHSVAIIFGICWQRDALISEFTVLSVYYVPHKFHGEFFARHTLLDISWRIAWREGSKCKSLISLIVVWHSSRTLLSRDFHNSTETHNYVDYLLSTVMWHSPRIRSHTQASMRVLTLTVSGCCSPQHPFSSLSCLNLLEVSVICGSFSILRVWGLERSSAFGFVVCCDLACKRRFVERCVVSEED